MHANVHLPPSGDRAVLHLRQFSGDSAKHCNTFVCARDQAGIIPLVLEQQISAFEFVHYQEWVMLHLRAAKLLAQTIPDALDVVRIELQRAAARREREKGNGHSLNRDRFQEGPQRPLPTVADVELSGCRSVRGLEFGECPDVWCASEVQILREMEARTGPADVFGSL